MSKDSDFLLTPAEMALVNARLCQRTGGRVQIGPDPVLNSQAKAVWEASRAFIVARELVPLPRRRSRRAALAIGGAAMSLSSCSMLNPNIKGSFDCRAPDGTCSPTTSIDNRALADIASGGAGVVEPIGTYQVPAKEPRLQTVSLRQTSPRRAAAMSGVVADSSPAAEPARSNERVLRIVFPAHIDRQGRFVEASAVHTVVERGAWLAADAGAAAPVRLSERPSLTDFAAAAPEFSFADLDGSRPSSSGSGASSGEPSKLASAPPSPLPSGAVSARSLPPGAPQLAHRAPGGPSSPGLAAAIPVQVRGQLQALKPIVVTPRNDGVTNVQQKSAQQETTQDPPRAADPRARTLSPAADAPPEAAGEPSSPASPAETAQRPPLMQTAPAAAGAIVQADVAAKLEEMRAAAASAARGAIAPDQPVNPPAHFSAAGVDQ